MTVRTIQEDLRFMKENGKLRHLKLSVQQA